MPPRTRYFWPWALYDLANSSFAVVIQTFVFATYFVNQVAQDKKEGFSLWGLALGLSGAVVAIGGPLIGAYADQGCHRKRWMLFFTVLVACSMILMWFVKPAPEYTLFALVLVSLGTIGSELAYIFYNAMLPELAGFEQIGRWSGWGWGMGYVGGMITLILSLFIFILPSPNETDGIRATFLFSAAWYIFFAFPIFWRIPSLEKKMPALFWKSLHQLWQTFIEVKKYKNIIRFLIARMIFTDALITLFAFGGVYAAAQFDMDEKEVLLFGIDLNIMAGIGALSFAYLDDKLGGRQIIIYSLIGLLFTGLGALLASHVNQFWIFGSLLGIFVGPVQASSRSYLARLAPFELRNQMFGLFALSSKVTSFIGPLAISWVTFITGSLKLGMSTILLFLAFGLILIFGVKRDVKTNSGD